MQIKGNYHFKGTFPPPGITPNNICESSSFMFVLLIQPSNPTLASSCLESLHRKLVILSLISVLIWQINYMGIEGKKNEAKEKKEEKLDGKEEWEKERRAGGRKSKQKGRKIGLRQARLWGRTGNLQFPSLVSPSHSWSSSASSSGSWLTHKTGSKYSFLKSTLQNLKLMKIAIDFKLAPFLLLPGYTSFHTHHPIWIFSRLWWNRYYHPKFTNGESDSERVSVLSCVSSWTVGLGLRFCNSNFTLLQVSSGFLIAISLSGFSRRCCPGILGILPRPCFFSPGFLPSSFKRLLPTSRSVNLPTLYYW